MECPEVVSFCVIRTEWVNICAHTSETDHPCWKPLWNASNFSIQKCIPVGAHAGAKIMFKLISDVFRGSTEGSLDILDISQSFPQGGLVVSHFSFLLGAHYKWLMLISLFLDLCYNSKCNKNALFMLIEKLHSISVHSMFCVYASVPSDFDNTSSPIGCVITIVWQEGGLYFPALSNAQHFFYTQWKVLACWQWNLSQDLADATCMSKFSWTYCSDAGLPSALLCQLIPKGVELNQMIPSGSPPTQLRPHWFSARCHAGWRAARSPAECHSQSVSLNLT